MIITIVKRMFLNSSIDNNRNFNIEVFGEDLWNDASPIRTNKKICTQYLYSNIFTSYCEYNGKNGTTFIMIENYYYFVRNKTWTYCARESKPKIMKDGLTTLVIK